MPFANHSLHRPSRPAVTFLMSAAWIVLCLLSSGELARLAPTVLSDFVRELIAAILLGGGFYALAKAWVPALRPLSSIGFVRRPGIGGEFARGAALGWGIAIALVLPALLTGNLSMQFALDAPTIARTVLSALVLGLFAIVVQLILSGLPIRMLLKATNTTWTVAAVIVVVTLLAFTGAASQGRTLPVMVLIASLFVAGFLRTRAIWFSLGLQLGWSLVLQVLFGASSPYTPATFGSIQSALAGPIWLTGGPFGPESSAIALVVLIVALVVLYRLTKEYAWHYTWQPQEGAGYAVTVAPPAEHTKEEQRHAAAAPLIQIGGIQPPQLPHKDPQN